MLLLGDERQLLEVFLVVGLLVGREALDELGRLALVLVVHHFQVHVHKERVQHQRKFVLPTEIKQKSRHFQFRSHGNVNGNEG